MHRGKVEQQKDTCYMKVGKKTDHSYKRQGWQAGEQNVRWREYYKACYVLKCYNSI